MRWDRFGDLAGADQRAEGAGVPKGDAPPPRFDPSPSLERGQNADGRFGDAARQLGHVFAPKARHGPPVGEQAEQHVSDSVFHGLPGQGAHFLSVPHVGPHGGVDFPGEHGVAGQQGFKMIRGNFVHHAFVQSDRRGGKDATVQNRDDAKHFPGSHDLDGHRPVGRGLFDHLDQPLLKQERRAGGTPFAENDCAPAVSALQKAEGFFRRAGSEKRKLGQEGVHERNYIPSGVGGGSMV